MPPRRRSSARSTAAKSCTGSNGLSTHAKTSCAGVGSLRYDKVTRFPKRRHVVATVLSTVLGLAIACAPSTARFPGDVTRGVPARLRVQVSGQVRTIALDDYVLGAALSEVTPVSESNRVAATVYEVQAIIARTYAVAQAGRHAPEGFDVCDRTHCQLYEPARIATSRFSAIARAAVARTTGRILRFNSLPALTLFHSDCGGHTTTPTAAWGGAALAYLPARQDEAGGTHRTWQFSATAEEWVRVLASDARTDPGGRLSGLIVSQRDASGRASWVRLEGGRGRHVTGETLRAVVAAQRGARSIMSTLFEIEPTPNGFVVKGRGFGHGVGLCQVGAMARARGGASVTAILAHYYPGAR